MEQKQGTAEFIIPYGMEPLFRAALNRKRIWLDVFDVNQRGRYLYEKPGYRRFKHGSHAGKALRCYEKLIWFFTSKS